MRKYFFIFFTFPIISFCQQPAGYSFSISYLPSICFKETTPVTSIKAENNANYHFNQIQMDVDRMFKSRGKWSVQTGFSFSYQRLYFKDLYSFGVYEYVNSAYYYQFEDKGDLSFNQFSLNVNLAVNYTLPNIRKHSSFLSIYTNYNALTLNSRKIKTNDVYWEHLQEFGSEEYYSLGNSLYLNRTNALYAGTHLHWALFKEPTPRTSFLILGLNYEFYNTPRLYNYRIFATVGLAVQFGKKKEKE